MEDCYLQPTSAEDKCKTHSLHSNQDSGIGSESSLSGGKVNSAFLHSPQSPHDMETSFSDEQKVEAQNKTAYLPMSISASSTGRMSDQSLTAGTPELTLPPPPGDMWLPAAEPQSVPSSGDGVLGYPGYPMAYPTYIHPSMSSHATRPHVIHPSMMSLPVGSPSALTAEEEAVLMKFRQDKLQNKGATRKRESLTAGTPDGEGGHLYEELPGGYPYAAHHQIKRQQSSSEGGKLPPHLPPLSSLPSASMASGLDDLDRDFEKKSSTIHKNNNLQSSSNPLYESHEAATLRSGSDFHSDYKAGDSNSSKIIYSNMDKQQGRHRCYCILLVLVLVISSAALAIAILSAMGAINMKESELVSDSPRVSASTGGDNIQNISSSYTEIREMVQQLTYNMTALMLQSATQRDEIAALRAEISTLESEKAELEVNLNNTAVDLIRYSSTNQPLFTAINSSLQTLNTELSSLNDEIQTVNTNLTMAVDQVSKQAGPPGLNGTQGPPGFIDITQCSHNKLSRSNVGFTLLNNESVSTPSVPDTESTRHISVYCIGRLFTSVNLNVTSITEGKSYKCDCYGGSDVTRDCDIHYWKCTNPQ